MPLGLSVPFLCRLLVIAGEQSFESWSNIEILKKLPTDGGFCH
jgi:hypothetical protein